MQKKEHPFLFFSRDDLPGLRKRFRHPDCRGLWQRVIRECEAALAGNPSDVALKHVRPTHFALAALIEEREDFAGEAINRSLAICDGAPWVKTAPGEERAGVCLATGSAVAQLGVIYDWLYAQLSETQRQRIRGAIREHGLDANSYAHERKHKGSDWYNCNGLGVINGPLLMASLLLEGEEDTREDLALSMRQILNSLESWCSDGGYQEGPLYWNYYTRHLLLGLEPLLRLKGIDWYQTPFARNTGDYILHHILPDITHCANSADSNDRTRLWPAIARLASRLEIPRLQWLAQRMVTHPWDADDGETLEYAPFFLLWYDPQLPCESPLAEDRSRLFQGLQCLSWRGDWTADARHVLWLNGPSNCHHNHLHLNSFTFTVGDQRLIRECGTHNYSNNKDYRRLTEGHNSLLVNGEGQAITVDDSYWCRRLRAGEWGSVYGLFENHREECDSPIATGVLRNAYPGRLNRFERTLVFVERQFIFLHDDIEPVGDEPVQLTWLFHGDREIECAGQTAVFQSERLSLRLQAWSRQSLQFRVHHDHCLHSKSGGPVEILPCLEIETRNVEARCDLYALMVPSDVASECSLQEHPEGMLFEVGGQRWIYEKRTRSIRREVDPPLPRMVV